MAYRFYIILIIFCFIVSCRKKINREVYLIPDHFFGNVIIIYNQPNGKVDSIADDIAFYKIPKSGILYVKGEQHVQILENMQYYYYSDKGGQKRLCDWMHKNNNCKEIVYTNQTQWYGASNEPDQRIYSIIIVGTRDSIPNDFDPAKFHFENIK